MYIFIYIIYYISRCLWIHMCIRTYGSIGIYVYVYRCPFVAYMYIRTNRVSASPSLSYSLSFSLSFFLSLNLSHSFCVAVYSCFRFG